MKNVIISVDQMWLTSGPYKFKFVLNDGSVAKSCSVCDLRKTEFVQLCDIAPCSCANGRVDKQRGWYQLVEDGAVDNESSSEELVESEDTIPDFGLIVQGSILFVGLGQFTKEALESKAPENFTLFDLVSNTIWKRSQVVIFLWEEGSLHMQKILKMPDVRKYV
jgi:hypothetical protein